MKLNIKKINKLLEKSYCVTVRETLFDKETFDSLIDQLRFEKIKGFVESYNSERVIVFRRNIVDGTIRFTTGNNESFFHNWKYFYDRKYSNHAYVNEDYYNSYYLIDYKDLFIEDEELE